MDPECTGCNGGDCDECLAADEFARDSTVCITIVNDLQWADEHFHVGTYGISWDEFLNEISNLSDSEYAALGTFTINHFACQLEC